MTIPIAIGGQPCTRARVHVPERGVWYADVDLVEAPELAGGVTLEIGALQLSGTIEDRSSGVFGAQRRARLVAGAGGWSTYLPPRAYHNDAEIRARTVAQDAAREAGESLGDFAPSAERIGVDYVRQVGPAARALEDVIGSASWWVAYDGQTHVGARATAEVDASRYEVLEHDPRQRIVVLAVDDPAAVVIGSVLSERLELPETVRGLEIDASAESIRMRVWCGEEPHTRGQLGGLLRALVSRAVDARLEGVYRYRVGQLQGDRLDLQPVSSRPGLPTILHVSMMPGLAGAHAELASGAHVLVAFIDGDRTAPIVTAFAGKDGVGWVPTSLLLDASGEIKIGAGATQPPALDNLVIAELQAIATTLTTGSNSGGPVVFGTPYTPPGSVGASKVLVE